MAPSRDNLSAVLHKARDLRLEQKELPEPGPQDVVIRIHKVGICGSDVYYWHRGRTARFVVQSPMVLGHEAAGVVETVGSQVTHLRPGDRVAIEPGVPCRLCPICKAGRYNVCPAVQFCATPPVDGTLTRLYRHPADFCYKLPDHVSLEEGALLEPLTVAVYGCQRAGVGLGSRVLVCGAGPIGVVSLLTARALAAARVCVTDISPSRLEFATGQGADGTVLIDGASEEELAGRVVAALGGPPTAILECCGAAPSVRMALQAAAPRAKLAFVGRGPPDMDLPMVTITAKELEINGVFRYANCYPLALDLVASGRVQLGPLVTHRFTLEESESAFQAALDGRGIKIMISVHD
ncbi:Sorbitol dehydrogenase [Amphibalanus amphitrite]|uniref:Sorbitol dehydrogenase n=1 Tax=Amphibalanus amphitrite TaxID=1232801 RepID=A0A6A4W7E4_AMPAM|nr:sorbitol dehydrogenase-like [Amphibalanus amphitrite]KAF0297968.1 Sorbitol dehydrogenase [Amphibalanus amphitrite]